LSDWVLFCFLDNLSTPLCIIMIVPKA